MTVEELNKFKNNKCIKCKNRKKIDCEIRKDINGNLKCLYEEEEENEY